MIPARDDPRLLRVASYNIRKCIGLDRRRAPERTLDVISSLHADVVALQEADRRLGRRPAAIPRRLIDAHAHLEAVDLAANEVSLGWHGNAILVREGINVTEVARLDLPFFEPRGAALAEIEWRGRPVRIVATHLGLMRRHRRRQLVDLAEQLGRRENMPTVILGDFNEWSPRQGLEALADYAVVAPGHTYHASRPVAALDRLALSRDIRLVHKGVQRLSGARRASDHLPIWADLDLGAGG